MDGWMKAREEDDGERRERELRRVSMTRLGCLVEYAKSAGILKFRPKTRHSSLVAKSKVQ